MYYPSGEVKQGAGFCFNNKWEHLGQLEKQDVNYLYSVFLAVSDLFILVSFIVYLTVPDQNKRGLNKNVSTRFFTEGLSVAMVPADPAMVVYMCMAEEERYCKVMNIIHETL